MNDKRERLIKYYMENPCLSEDIDYEDEKTRAEHYKILVYDLNEDDLNEELEFFINDNTTKG